MREDIEWLDWGHLQHTSRSLPCEIECQGHLATRWWGHVVPIGVYGICYRQLTWCWHDPGQWADHLGWFSLGRDVAKHRGATHYLQLLCQPWHEVRLFPYCWCFRQLCHCICFIAPWGMDTVYHNLLWVSISYSSTVDCINEQLITWECFLSVHLYCVSFLPLSKVLMMGGLLSSIILSGLLAGSTRTVALCMPVTFYRTVPEDSVLCRAVGMARGCEQVQLGHCEADFCGLFFWAGWPWQRACIALPAHIAAAPDSMV